MASQEPGSPPPSPPPTSSWTLSLPPPPSLPNRLPPPPTENFPFHRLPPEIRDQIWVLTLPDRRVFEVSTITKERYADRRASTIPRAVHERPSYLDFRYRHAPPVALHICHESRVVALRHGLFLEAAGNENPGVWFKPDTDLVYLQKVHYDHMISHARRFHTNVQGLNKILHVGIKMSDFLIHVCFHHEPSGVAVDQILEDFQTRIPNLESLIGITLKTSLPRWREVTSAEYSTEPLLPLNENTYASLESLTYEKFFEQWDAIYGNMSGQGTA